MIMPSVAAEPAVLDSRLQRLLQTKRHQRFGRDIDAFTFRQYLCAGPRRRANPTANRCAFSAAGNGADDRADCRASADEFACTLIGAKAVRLLRADDTVLRLNRIALPVYRDGLQI